MTHLFINQILLRRCIVLLLCLMLTYVPSMPAQVAGGPAGTASADADRSLKVVVLDGNHAFNTLGDRTAAQPVVEVRNQDDKPLSGVTVVFQAPPLGPGASFPGGKSEQQTVTNTQGQATTKGMVPNAEKGQFHIKVIARLGDRVGSAIITQQNVDQVPAEKRSSSRWWKYALILGAAGGAAGAIAAGMGGGGTSGPGTTPATLTLTPGNISIGGPR
jgi:hypothetical protein